MSEIKIFSNEQFGEVRVAGTAEEPLFCLSDLCKAVELTNPSSVKKRLEPEDTQLIDLHALNYQMVGNSMATFVNETVFFEVLLFSSSLKVKPFRRWVTHEVLPSIRKTDSYSVEQQTPKTYIEALKALVASEEEKERLALENKQAAEKVAELEPKGKFYDTVTKSSATISVAMASKILNFKKAGRNNLYKILFEQKMIDHQNMPYQKYIERGMLVLGSQEFMKYGKSALRYVPRITHKGLEYIMNLLIDLGYKQREEYSGFNPYDIDFSELYVEENY